MDTAVASSLPNIVVHSLNLVWILCRKPRSEQWRSRRPARCVDPVVRCLLGEGPTGSGGRKLREEGHQASRGVKTELCLCIRPFIRELSCPVPMQVGLGGKRKFSSPEALVVFANLMLQCEKGCFGEDIRCLSCPAQICKYFDKLRDISSSTRCYQCPLLSIACCFSIFQSMLLSNFVPT